MIYHFGNLSRLEAEAKKRKVAEQQAQAAKEKQAAAAKAAENSGQ